MVEINGVGLWECWSEPGKPICLASKNDKGASVLVYYGKNGKIKGLAVHGEGSGLELVWGKVPAAFLADEARYR